MHAQHLMQANEGFASEWFEPSLIEAFNLMLRLARHLDVLELVAPRQVTNARPESRANK